MFFVEVELNKVCIYSINLPIVVLFFPTSHRWYPRSDTMLMKNKAATKNRNKIWNLAWVSGSCFFRMKGKTKHTFSWLIVTALSPIMWKMKQIDTTLFPQYNKVLHGNKILFHCWTMWQDPLSCVKCAAENPLKIATGWYWYTWCSHH